MDTELTLALNDQRHGLNNYSLTPSTKLASLKYFPQPIFLLDREMHLIEANSQGTAAIDKHWVGLRLGKIHFNNSEHNKQISVMVDSLFAARCIFLPTVDT